MKKSFTAFSFHGGFTASRYAHIVVMLPKVSSLSPIPHPNIRDSVKRWPGFDMLAWHGERSEHWLPPLLSQREQALRPGFSLVTLAHKAFAGPTLNEVQARSQPQDPTNVYVRQL